jgi:hypothetical protein
MLRAVEETHQGSAEWLSARVSNAALAPEAFRTALMAVPAAERDCWLDLVLGLDSIPVDGPELPRGGVPYLPCPVDTLLRMVELAEVRPSDVFVDIGSGVGRTAALVGLLTGATTIGIEVQPALVVASRELEVRVRGLRLSVIEGDAAKLTDHLALGSLFFLYCPFSGERLEKILSELELIARTRQIRVCCVDLPVAPRTWLTRVPDASGGLAVYRSTLAAAPLGTAHCGRPTLA